MPVNGQIIPQYLQPHVATYINDNTIFTDTAAAPVSPLRTLQVFASKKGRDNQIIIKDTVADYLAEYGNPDFKLYGQPCYMPYAFLSTGLGRVFCLRVMPDDAAYSNIMIVAKVKVVTIPPATEPVMVIKYVAQYFPAITTSSDFYPVVESLRDETPDADGYKTYPLMLFYSQGRGSYGDGFRVRVSSSMDGDKDNEYKNYRIEVFTTDNGLNRVEMLAASLYNDAVQGIAKTSYFIEDVVNESSSNVKCYISKSTLESVYNIYKTIVDPTTAYTLLNFDMLIGTNKITAGLENKIIIERTEPDAVSIDRIEGLVFSGGDDGAFSSSADPADRAAAINDAYVSAFAGDTDKRILSKRRTPCDVMFDANYDDLVKKMLLTLVIKRYDAYGYIDAGLLNTSTDAVDWADAMQDYSDRVFSKDCQHFKIRDPFSGKTIPMTMTYYLASRLPGHFKSNGNHVPFVGENYARLTGYVKDSLYPVIDADDMAIKEKLYLRRVNYFEAIAEDNYIRGTQTTSQFGNDISKWSDLSEENNMLVLLEMKRIIETYVASKTYNFVSATERRAFAEDMSNRFAGYPGTKIASFSVDFQMNQWELERSILHCYLSVVFRTMAKRGIIEIDINKRTS